MGLQRFPRMCAWIARVQSQPQFVPMPPIDRSCRRSPLLPQRIGDRIASEGQDQQAANTVDAVH
jgi:hypothetical protein